MSKLLEKTREFEWLSQISSIEIKKILLWFKTQNLLVQIMVCSEQSKIFYVIKNKSETNDKSLIAFVSLIMAANKYRKNETLLNRKNGRHSLADIKNLTNFELLANVGIPKISEKRNKILALFSKIETLRMNEYSWANIVDLLLRKHRVEVSSTYLIKIYKQMKNEKNKNR